MAPAGPVDPNELDTGIEALKSLGYTVRLGKYLYSKKKYLGGQDSQRLEDLNIAIRDQCADAIFCARGGYGSMRLLSEIDYESFSKMPKIFVGFSDITALLNALYYKAGVVTFHGPMVKNFQIGKERSLQGLIQVISSGQPWELGLDQARILRPGHAEGVILGGNLSIITSLIGSPYLPHLSGCILFIEDTNEPLYRIDRMLNAIKLKGELGRVKGIVAGEFHSCGGLNEIDELLFDVTKDLSIPVISGVPFGHGESNIPFPIGLEAVLDTEMGMIHSVEAPVA